MLISSATDSATDSSLLGVGIFFAIFAGLFWFIAYFKGASEKEERRRDKKARWQHSDLIIRDVQRIDNRVTQTTTTGGGTGVAVDVGYGLMVGGASGASRSISHESVKLGWQLYTNLGIIYIRDEVYNAWLFAGRPEHAKYAVMDSSRYSHI